MTKLAFVVLFAALCWSAPTTAVEEFSPTLHTLPRDLVHVITECLPAHDLASLGQVDRYTHGVCKPDLTKLKAPKLKFYIGETPTFMPAVKRCLMYDDLSCYHLVLEHFTQKKGLVQGHHLAQMPALAAQLGASKIFRSFGKNGRNPLWNHWMTRAVIRFRFDFLKQVAGIPYNPHIALLVDSSSPFSDFYADLCFESQFTQNIVEPNTAGSLEWYFNYYASIYKDCFVKNIVTKQPSIWKNIFESLELENKRKRKKALLKLKNKIVDILSQGVYVIDDIMLNPINTHVLWEKYVKPQEDEPDDRSDFVMWLIGEGSPISDLIFLKVLGWNPGMRSNFEPELKMAVNYASGSVTASLVRQLRINSASASPQGIEDALSTFKDVLHANFLDPMVLKYAKILVETKHRYGATEMYRDSVKNFFKEQGHDLSEL